VDYHLEFLTSTGCSMKVLDEMARLDGARVLAMVADAQCGPSHVRRATLRNEDGRLPNMDRWSTFMVGARRVHRFRCRVGEAELLFWAANPATGLAVAKAHKGERVEVLVGGKWEVVV